LVCTQTVTYKKFGISLNFTPVVLSEGRISLHVMTEVSDISMQNAINIGGVTIPSLTTRRAETSLEIPSGGAMAMAGLIQNQTKQAINGLPGMMQLPVLGTLFRSRDFVRNESELVIIITPYLTRPVARNDLAKPDDNFNPPSDGAGMFLGRVNRVYGTMQTDRPSGRYHGVVGFIYK
jgi:pilus assembly protein CpaC